LWRAKRTVKGGWAVAAAYFAYRLEVVDGLDEVAAGSLYPDATD
jgi:hypothetical protein